MFEDEISQTRVSITLRDNSPARNEYYVFLVSEITTTGIWSKLYCLLFDKSESLTYSTLQRSHNTASFIEHTDHRPRVLPVIDNRIYHSICHSEPVYPQVDVLYVIRIHNFGIVILVQEEHLLWQPAQGEQDHNQYEHLYNLGGRKILFRNSWIEIYNRLSHIYIYINVQLH